MNYFPENVNTKTDRVIMKEKSTRLGGPKLYYTVGNTNLHAYNARLSLRRISILLPHCSGQPKL